MSYPLARVKTGEKIQYKRLFVHGPVVPTWSQLSPFSSDSLWIHNIPIYGVPAVPGQRVKSGDLSQGMLQMLFASSLGLAALENSGNPPSWDGFGMMT